VSDVAKTSGRPYFAEMYLFSDNWLSWKSNKGKNATLKGFRKIL
jgi:hypothetical protein